MDPSKPYLNRPPPPQSFPPNFSVPPPVPGCLPPRTPTFAPKYPPASSNYHYNPTPPPPPPSSESYKKKPWAAPIKSIFSKIAELSKEEKTSSSRRVYDEPSSAPPSRRDDRERYYSKSVDRECAPSYQSKSYIPERRAQSVVPEKYSQSSSSSHSYNRRHYERPSDNNRERSSSKYSSSSDSKGKTESEREQLLAKWRKNFCETSEDIAKKLAELSYDEDEKKVWVRSSPADIFYKSLDNKLVSV
jgi:ribonuclease III